MNVIGIDEVGRGAWAGPLVVGAVRLESDITGLKDSKKLSKNQRQRLAVEIYDKAEFIGLGWVSAGEIDDLGLTKATSLACERALVGVDQDSPIVIDGNYNYLPNWANCSVMVNGDASIAAISAASIIAKVARDNYMTEQSLQYPDYGFEVHVGYGTKAHTEAIQQHGLTGLHRWSYKNFRDSFFVEFSS